MFDTVVLKNRGVMDVVRAHNTKQCFPIILPTFTDLLRSVNRCQNL